MPLVIRLQGRYDVPQVVCDCCQQVITDASDGNYQWCYTTYREGETARIAFTHKACADAFERQHGGNWGVMELAALPAFLANNLHVSWKKTSTVAQMMSRE